MLSTAPLSINHLRWDMPSPMKRLEFVLTSVVAAFTRKGAERVRFSVRVAHKDEVMATESEGVMFVGQLEKWHQNGIGRFQAASPSVWIGADRLWTATRFFNEVVGSEILFRMMLPALLRSRSFGGNRPSKLRGSRVFRLVLFWAKIAGGEMDFF